MKILKYFAICASIFFFSCEYDLSDDHFVEKEEPIVHKDIEINLYGVKDNDTIYIYDKTWLSYSINEDFDKILKTEITLDGTLLEDSYNTILINPESFDNSIHKLKLSVESTSGTNSLAEKLNLERYVGEKEYTLKYIHVDKGLKIADCLSDDGYLKIFWKKPNIEGLEFDRYEITYDKDWSWDSKITITINDPEQTYIIDKNYVHGYKDYQIRTFFKENKIDSWSDRYTMSYNPLGGIEPKMEATGLETALVTWSPNKYKCTYLFEYDHNDEISRIAKQLDYSITKQDVHLMLFPYEGWGTLNVLPENYDVKFSNWGKVVFSQEPYSLLQPRYHYIYSYATNNKHNFIYGADSHKIHQFDTFSKKLISTTWINNLNYFRDDKISCSSNTGTVAVLHCYYSLVYLFDKDMTQLNKFEIKRNTTYTSKDDVFCVTDNNLIIVSGMNTSRYLQIYNISGVPLYNIDVPVSPYKTKITASTDGKYICIYTNHSIKIYKLGELEATLYRDISATSVSNCYFDPISSDELIVQEADYFYKQDIETLNKTDKINGTYINTDPYTGYLFYYDINYKSNKKGYIIKAITDAVTYDVKLSHYYDQDIIGNTHLINNTIFTNNPYWNISKYLK